MSSRHLAVALLCCALPLSPAHAADEAAAATTVKWVVPWKAGMSLDYAMEQLETETKGTVHSKTRTAGTETVLITQASKDGFVQVWNDTDGTFEVLEGDKAMEGPVREAMAVVRDLPLEVDLDAAGNYRRLRNIDVVHPAMQKAMRPTVQFGFDAGLAKVTDPKEREKLQAEGAKRLDATIQTVFTPQFVEALVTRQIQTYNGFVGIDLEPDQSYELETQLPNPMGGPAFPSKLTVSLSVSEDDPEDLFVAFDVTIDPEKAGAAGLAMVEKMAGKKLPGVGKDALKVVVADEGLFVVHRPTGVIEMFESIRTTKAEGMDKVERHRMRLLNGDHEHVWKDEQTEETAATE